MIMSWLSSGQRDWEFHTTFFFDLSRPSQLLLLISDVAISKQHAYRLWPQLCRIYRYATELWSHIKRMCFHLPLKEQLNVTVWFEIDFPDRLVNYFHFQDRAHSYKV